ncbi:MAG: flavodoxin family protein [Thermoprotei archaeon]
MRVKILLINGSPRKYGSSAKLLAIAEEGVRDAGGDAEYIHLYDYKIKECIGCVSDDVLVCRFPCIIRDDDFNKIGEKLLEAHGFILATPVYWYSVPGPVKNFIDRLTSMENMIHHTGKSLLEGKIAGFIAVGNDVGALHTIAYLMAVANSMGIHIPPWALAYSHMKEVLEDKQAVIDAYNAGYIVAKAATLLHEAGAWYNPKKNLDILVKKAIEYTEKFSEQKKEREKLFNKLSKA